MDPAIRSDYEAARGIRQRDFASACYAPFTSLYFNTNGDVISCCKNTSYVLGNIATERLDDIWHGKRVAALRKALVQYKFGLGCEFCEWQIQARQFDQAYTRTFDHLPLRGETPQWPSMLEFTISNTCNLACIMCYGELSSTIRAQRENLPPLPKVYDDQFFADLRKYLPHLQVAKFFGGEPFLAQENYRVWDMMIEDGVVIPCHVTTNGTQWNSKVERVLDALPISLSISVDGATKATAESIRVNMNFETVTRNVERFLEYARRKRTSLSLTYCLMRQNWHEWGDYVRYAERLGVDVYVNTVIDPPHCSLYTLPPDELMAIVAKLEHQEAEQKLSALPINGARWLAAIDTLRKSAESRQAEAVQSVKDAHRKRKEQLRPDHISAAWTHIIAGDPAAALEEVRQVGDGEANAYEARVLEGRALRDLGRADEALQVLGRAVEMWRKAPNAFVERGWVYLSRHQLDLAKAECDQAQALLGARADARLAPAVYHLSSAVASAAGDHAAALRYADQLVKADPRADFYLHRAYIHQQMGNRAAVRADAESALAKQPDHSGARQLLASLPAG